VLRLHRYLHVSLAQEPADKNPWLVPSPGIDTPGGYRKGQHASDAIARGARGVTAHVIHYFDLLSPARERGGARSLPLSR